MKHSLIYSLTIFLTLLAVIFSAVGVTPAYALTWTVYTNADSGDGSLRYAIANATSDDIITFDPSLSGATIHLASTLVISGKDLTIDGSALASPIIISGDTDGNGVGDVRIFQVNSGVVVTLDSLIITQGYSDYGGGIYNHGTLTITNSALSGNSAVYVGGIFNSGTLTVINSTLSGNSSGIDSGGGGIYNSPGSTLTVTNSTVSGNFAHYGGGIYNQGNLWVTNSTVSGNFADADGGGIYNYGTARVYNTSIVFNSADADFNGGSAGGIFNNDANGAVISLRNTLMAGNYAGNATNYDDCRGTVNSYLRNLFGTKANCNVVDAPGFEGGSTILNSLSSIGPLRDNGGPTFTHALLSGSNAIDGGDPTFGCRDYSGSLILTDQRGFARVAGARCDIGAYEFIDYSLNGGFNIYPTGTSKIPTSWKAVNFSTSDGKNTTVKKEGTASVRIIGTGVSKTLSQTLLLNGLKDDPFTLSFWVKGSSIPTAGICRAQILFYNGATLNPVKKTINCGNGTYAFKQKLLSFTAPGDYTKIVIRFTYSKASGKVWFDAVSLVR